MTEITRFEMDMDGSMEPSEHGEWVRYEDAQRTWVELTGADKCKPDLGKWVELNEDWLDGYQAGLEFANKKLKEKNT
jgi:hypothetical protein